MKYLLRALSAEMLKTKRTLTLALAFLAPLAVAFLALVICFQSGQTMFQESENAWLAMIESVLIMWSLLMMPLFVTLEMGLLGALEHNNKGWKQIYTQPLPRWSIYAAKQVIGMGVIGLSMAALMAMTVGVGLFARAFLPKLGFDAPIPWGTLASSLGLSFLAAWLVISIQLWVSLRWSSFVAAIGVGVVATVFGVVVFSTDWDKFYPWTLPGVVSLGMLNARPYAPALAIGIICGIAAALIGGWEATRHDVLS